MGEESKERKYPRMYNNKSIKQADKPQIIIIIIITKNKTCKIVDFAVPADHRIKLKAFEKKDKYLDLARELKKLWNMQVTIIPILIGAFGSVTKGLLKGLEDLEDEWRPSKRRNY